MIFAAVDAGTTGARACAVDASGRVVREERRPYPTASPAPGWAEQSAEDWRACAIDALEALVASVGEVEAIGLTGQCPTVAPLGGSLEPVGPGLLYRDNRAVAEALEMRARVGEETMHARTGHLADAFHVGPKVLWMRAHAPDVFARASVFAQPRDVVLHALTGSLATDETHANSTVFFDLRERAWADDLLAEFELTSAAFPPVLAPWAVAGMTAGGRPVVIGAADSQCAAYGSGVDAPGAVSEMAGASSCLNSIVGEPLSEPAVTHYSHVVPDVFCTELGINTSGAAIAWAVAQLRFEGFDELAVAAAAGRDLVGAAADPVAAAPLFLPYLGDGERDDVALRGGFIGLSDRHGREALAYAVLEGVALGVAETVGVLAAAGSPCSELRVAGGGARLDVLGELKADALGVPVRHLQDDTAAVGAALLAASATGHGDVARAAIAEGVARGRVFEPSGGGGMALRREWFERVRPAEAVRV